jgi:hypothetical protein
MYYSGFSHDEAMNLPIWKRKWFVDRLIREISDSKTSRGAHENDVESRVMKGNQRDVVPAKLRRFT